MIACPIYNIVITFLPDIEVLFWCNIVVAKMHKGCTDCSQIVMIPLTLYDNSKLKPKYGIETFMVPIFLVLLCTNKAFS